MIRIRIESDIIFSGLMFRFEKSKISTASLVPMPDIEIGTMLTRREIVRAAAR